MSTLSSNETYYFPWVKSVLYTDIISVLYPGRGNVSYVIFFTPKNACIGVQKRAFYPRKTRVFVIWVFSVFVTQ